MTAPLIFIEELAKELPQVNEIHEDFLVKSFLYESKAFELTFYKVKEYGKQFWLYNPCQVKRQLPGIV